MNSESSLSMVLRSSIITFLTTIYEVSLIRYISSFLRYNTSFSLYIVDLFIYSPTSLIVLPIYYPLVFFCLLALTGVYTISIEASYLLFAIPRAYSPYSSLSTASESSPNNASGCRVVEG